MLRQNEITMYIAYKVQYLLSNLKMMMCEKGQASLASS